MPKLRHIFSRLPWRAISSVLVAFVITRAMVFTVTYLSLSELPLRSGEYWRVMPKNLIADGLVRWDSGYYLDIVQNGYQTTQEGRYAVFFPFYSMLVWVVYHLFGHLYLSGLWVSNLMFLIALGYLYALTYQEYGEAIAGRAVFYLAAAPAAFIFSAFYTDSTLLAFVIACFYYARNRHWGLAALTGAAASATQVTGFLVAVFMVLEGLYQQGAVFLPRPWSWKAQWSLIQKDIQLIPRAFTSLMAAVGTMAGWLTFMVYEQRVFGDPLAFIHNHVIWGNQLSWDWLPRLIQNTTFRLNVGSDLLAGQINVNFLQDVAATLIFLPLVIAVLFKMRPSYAWFTLLMYLVAPISANLESMRRFVLWLVPCYMLMGVWGKRQWVDRLILGFSFCLQTYMTILFTHWYFGA